MKIINPLLHPPISGAIISGRTTSFQDGIFIMEYYIPRPREQALEQLEAYILEHNLQANDRLPPEREMCKMWGINRTTLRGAIARLESSGRLFAVQGSGTCISPRFRRTLHDRDRNSFIEYSTNGDCCLETRPISVSVIQGDEDPDHAFSLPQEENLYRIRRMHLLDGVPVMLETAYVPVALAPGLERRTDFSATSDSVFQILRTDYRLDVSPMEEKAFLSPVREEEEQLLNLSHGESAYLILTKMTLKDGTPAEYGRTVGRTDRIEIAGRLLWQNGKEEQE